MHIYIYICISLSSLLKLFIDAITNYNLQIFFFFVIIIMNIIFQITLYCVSRRYISVNM